MSVVGRLSANTARRSTRRVQVRSRGTAAGSLALVDGGARGQRTSSFGGGRVTHHDEHSFLGYVDDDRNREGQLPERERALSTSRLVPDLNTSSRQLDIDQDEWSEELAERYEETADKIQETVSLWRWDAATSLLDYLQLYGVTLLVAAQLRVWPESWVRGSLWLLVFNLDVWGLREHADYSIDTSQPVPSTTVTDKGADYYTYMACWTAMPAAFGLMYFTFHKLAPRWVGSDASREKIRKKWALRIQMVGFFLAQWITVPLAVVYGRTFHCAVAGEVNADSDKFGAKEYVSTVDNSVGCGASEQRTLMAVSALFMLAYGVGLAYVMGKLNNKWTYLEVPAQHEVYLRFKETEYTLQTDTTWADGKFYLFSSYRRNWSDYKCYIQILKVLLAAGFCLVKKTQRGQVSVLAAVCILYLFISCKRPLRVRASNWIQILLAVGTVLNVVTVMMHEYGNNSENTLLETDNLTVLLNTANLVPFVVVVLMWTYLELRDRGLLGGKPIWPVVFDPHASDELFNMYNASAAEKKKYAGQLRLLAASRSVIVQNYMSTPLLAPVHDVMRCLLIANAMARDTSSRVDALHYALWDLVHELADAYNKNDGKSIFALAQKETTNETARELITLLPALSKRLHERDFDLFLVKPQLKSILMKLLVISKFMGGRRAWAFEPAVAAAEAARRAAATPASSE